MGRENFLSGSHVYFLFSPYFLCYPNGVKTIFSTCFLSFVLASSYFLLKQTGCKCRTMSMKTVVQRNFVFGHRLEWKSYIGLVLLFFHLLFCGKPNWREAVLHYHFLFVPFLFPCFLLIQATSE